LAVAVSAAVIVAVTDPTTGGANGSGAGSGIGPGKAADVSVAGAFGGSTNSASAADFGLSVLFVLSVLSVLVAAVDRAIEGAAMAEIGVIRIAKASRQATRTCSLGGVGSGDNCFTTNLFLESAVLTKWTLGRRESAKSLSNERKD
jgi:hypothetical protein